MGSRRFSRGQDRGCAGHRGADDASAGTLAGSGTVERLDKGRSAGS